MSLNAQRSAHISFSCLYDISSNHLPICGWFKTKPKGNEYYKENDKRLYLDKKVSFDRLIIITSLLQTTNFYSIDFLNIKKILVT